MSIRRRWLRRLAPWCLGAALLGQVGCLTCCHPVPTPAPEQVMACQTVPACCRSHVYVFLIDGLDPVRFCNFVGVHDYLISLGYHSTYHGELYHCFWFNSEIRQIHKEDPDARFVLVGHGVGAKMARSMAHDLQDENIAINLLVYVDGSWLGSGGDRPGNVARIINARVAGNVWTGTDLPDADNVRLDGASTFSAATNQTTLDLLGHELMQIAMTVPSQPVGALKPPPALDAAPTPRPVQRSTTAARDEWDFLKPTAQLQASSPVHFTPSVDTATAPAATKPYTTLKPNETR
jgi:pimeloyl-ACP methyl ester carboxylesterase